MNNLKPIFNLDDLIAKERLICSGTFADLEAVFNNILPTNKNEIATPLLIGIDGSVTAGKSYLATALCNLLLKRGINCTVIHGDWFMSSREQRKKEVAKAASGAYDIANYDTAACDFEALAHIQHLIYNFLHSNDEVCTVDIPNAYDRETGRTNRTVHLTLKRHSIIIIEGTGVLRAATNEDFDLTIRVDIGTYKETIERLTMREHKKPMHQRLSIAFIKERYDLIDYPYDQYLRARDSCYFDVLLDTSHKSLMRLYQHP